MVTFVHVLKLRRRVDVVILKKKNLFLIKKPTSTQRLRGKTKHGRRGFSVMGCVDISTFSNHFRYICLPPTCVRFLGFLSAKLFYRKMQKSVAGSAVGRSAFVLHDCGRERFGGREEWTG